MSDRAREETREKRRRLQRERMGTREGKLEQKETGRGWKGERTREPENASEMERRNFFISVSEGIGRND